MSVKYLVGFLLAIAALIGVWTYAGWEQPIITDVPARPADQGTFFEVRGMVTCLPHKGDGPHTMECAFGLKAQSGKHYALKNLWEVAPDIMDTNVDIEVKGYLTAPEANEKYDIEGVIDVSEATKI